jgi:hypothetical protein
MLLQTATWTILLSVVLHGISASPWPPVWGLHPRTGGYPGESNGRVKRGPTLAT